MHQKTFSERRLTIGYLVALSLVALLTIASHLTLSRVLAEHEGSAKIVNVSGRQRMLSQRISSLAAQYRMGSLGAKSDLLEAVNQFEAAHHKLLASSVAADSVDRSSNTFRDIYFGGETPLDGEVAAYIALAREIAAHPPNAADMSQILNQLFDEAHSPLLIRLDGVVARHQSDSEQQLGLLELLQGVTLAVVLITLVIEALTIFRPMVRRIARCAGELLQLATTDGLTGTLNRTSFITQATAYLDQAQRGSQQAALLMLDADHFKLINDTNGHDGGDAALRALGHAIRLTCRTADLAGRLGGEEFAVFLPDTSESTAMDFAQQLRATVERLSIQHSDRFIHLTISIGVASTSSAECFELPALLKRADHALYKAKGGGRNRVAVISPLPQSHVLA